MFRVQRRIQTVVALTISKPIPLVSIMSSQCFTTSKMFNFVKISQREEKFPRFNTFFQQVT